MVERHGHFVWYELMTTDVEAARAFYVEVMGWGARDASAPGAGYTLFTVGETSVGGLMTLTEDARKLGAQPRWLGYIGVDDVDAAVDRIRHLGGAVHVPPTDIPDVSRFSVVADPQMAMLVLIAWTDPGDGPLVDMERQGDMGRAGHVGWHELVAAEWKSAFAFYAELFGWQKADVGVDPTGAYLLFSAAGRTIGGMFTKPAVVPVPFWLYYFNVSDVDAAAKRVVAAGGEILEGPLQLPSGAWAARCADPQGAVFALLGHRSKTPIGYFERAAPREDANARGRRWSW